MRGTGDGDTCAGPVTARAARERKERGGERQSKITVPKNMHGAERLTGSSGAHATRRDRSGAGGYRQAL